MTIEKPMTNAQWYPISEKNQCLSVFIRGSLFLLFLLLLITDN